MKQYIQVEQSNGYSTYVHRDSVEAIVPSYKHNTGYIALWGGYKIHLSEETVLSYLYSWLYDC